MEALLFACLPLVAMASSSALLLRYSFTGVRTYFFCAPMRAEDQLRNPASWTEQLWDFCRFHQEIAIVELARPQTDPWSVLVFTVDRHTQEETIPDHRLTNHTKRLSFVTILHATETTLNIIYESWGSDLRPGRRTRVFCVHIDHYSHCAHHGCSTIRATATSH